MPTVRFFRHAASRSNDGPLHGHPDWATLSAQGHESARVWAQSVDRPPDLLVLSPALRSSLTAAPLMARHPGLLAEVWPVGEFTYLATGRAAHTSPDTRRPWVSAYWSQEDPLSCDGTGAESYAALFKRAWSVRERLQAWSRSVPAEAQLWMVSHAQFLWALGWCLSAPSAHAGSWPPMRAFRLATARPDWPALGWQEWASPEQSVDGQGAACTGWRTLGQSWR